MKKRFAGIGLIGCYLGLLWVAFPGKTRPPQIGTGLGWLAPPDEISCTPWRQVSDGGFGLPSRGAAPENGEPYRGEEGFEVLVFNHQLYLGMEADNSLGARLWRTRSGIEGPQAQEDWEEVIADERNLPWGVENLPQVDHIDSLAEFHHELYASSANSGDPSGARVFRSSTGDPGSWQDALLEVGPGFGKPQNENFKDMQVFEGWLCGGTWNEMDGAEVWCTRDGTNWQQKNRSGFGDSANIVIWSGGVYDGAIYFSVERSEGGRIYRSRSLEGEPEWELIFEGRAGSGAPLLLESWGARIYMATRSIDGIRIFSSATGDPGSWQAAGRPGITGDRLNTFTVTDGAAVYRGALHVAVQNPLAGFRVWRLAGSGLWELVGRVREYDPASFAAQLLVFEGRLLAWASNYRTGQVVLQTSCRSGTDSWETRQSLSLIIVSVLGAAFTLCRRRAGRERV